MSILDIRGGVVPSCRVYNSALITISNTTSTALTFDSERFDTDAMHSTASATSKITFNTAGVYSYGGNVAFTANAVGERALPIRLNGTTSINLMTQTAVAIVDAATLIVTGIYRFVAGDYIELMAYQSSGGNLDIVAGANYSPEFWAVWAGG